MKPRIIQLKIHDCPICAENQEFGLNKSAEKFEGFP